MTGKVPVPVKMGLVILPSTGLVIGVEVVDSVPERKALLELAKVEFRLGVGDADIGDGEVDEGAPPVPVKVPLLVALVE